MGKKRGCSFPFFGPFPSALLGTSPTNQKGKLDSALSRGLGRGRSNVVGTRWSATADYKGLRDKMKNIRFLPNATTKSTLHFEHDICIINLTIIIAVHLSVYTLRH